ncbi:MAG TPA: LptF/LptG family permease [Gemmatales bacterium]|nr:LptF/LptG family permease [Gemmatales bacterium]
MLLIHRYIMWELLRIFLLALVGLSSIVVMAGIVQETAQQGLGPEHILMLIPMLLPSTLPYTVPATMLFTVAVVYGRLAADNEITALKASGIPIRVAIWPALLLSLIVSAGIFAMHYEYIPHTHHRLREMAFNESEEFLYAKLRRDLCFNEPGVNYSIYVREVHGRRLIGPIFKQRNQKGEYDMIASAEEAEIRVDLKNKEILISLILADVIKDGNSYRADKEPIRIPFPKKLERVARARERSIPEILERRPIAEKEEEDERKLLGTLPSGSSEDLQQRYRYNEKKREVGELRVELAERPALALGCFFFVLIGCPVAIWFQKSDFLSSFITSFLPIVLVYYPLQMLTKNLGKEEINEHLAMWIGNGVLGVTGLFMLWRLGRR